MNREVSKPHSQSAASIFRVQQSSLQLGYRQNARNMVTQTHSRGRKIQVWYRPTWKIKKQVWEEWVRKNGCVTGSTFNSETTALVYYSWVYNMLISLFLYYIYFSRTTVKYISLPSSYFIMPSMPSAFYSSGSILTRLQLGGGKRFVLQACRWALRPTHPPIQQKPGACFPQKNSQVIKILTHLPLNAEIVNVWNYMSTLPCFHGKALVKNSDNHTLYLPLPFTQFIILGHTAQCSFNLLKPTGNFMYHKV
jgi:hypothetical protein